MRTDRGFSRIVRLPDGTRYLQTVPAPIPGHVRVLYPMGHPLGPPYDWSTEDA